MAVVPLIDEAGNSIEGIKAPSSLVVSVPYKTLLEYAFTNVSVMKRILFFVGNVQALFSASVIHSVLTQRLFTLYLLKKLLRDRPGFFKADIKNLIVRSSKGVQVLSDKESCIRHLHREEHLCSLIGASALNMWGWDVCQSVAPQANDNQGACAENLWGWQIPGNNRGACVENLWGWQIPGNNQGVCVENLWGWRT